ncbi:MAG TPA: hypothetical protein VFZ09_09655 [Archangium sp.]|uniref:hypothetical protein n=1 Tax=Archangium sp. TaxID=1872627 RepID=UPI002E35B69C|nr:hypothetical protein [Archangium sp.]HEX5746498.1 hypothetical protein [Archangium sp.]
MVTPSNITFDDSLWPLLIVRFSGTPNKQQFEEYMAMRGRYLARNQKHALIYDTVRFNVLNPEQRQRQIDWLKQHKELLGKLSLGSALVITSPVIRLSLSLVLQFSQASAPYHAARSMPDAASWCAGRLASAGLLTEARRVRTHFGLAPRQGTA